MVGKSTKQILTWMEKNNSRGGGADLPFVGRTGLLSVGGVSIGDDV